MSSVRLAAALLAATTLACSSSSTGSGSRDSGPPAEGGGHDTWNNFAQAFMVKYCVECHNATTTEPMQNFNVYADVVGLDKTIRCGVAPAGQVQSGCPTSGFPPPGQFPISDSTHSNPKPTDAERLRLIAWIDAGAPQ